MYSACSKSGIETLPFQEEFNDLVDELDRKFRSSAFRVMETKDATRGTKG
jgi:hypothetical protein